MLTANEIVKEQMVQTTSKKIVRSSEKQKPRTCVPHTHPTSGLKVLCGLQLAAQTSLVFSKSAGVKTIFPATCFFNKSTSLVNLF